MCHDNGSLDGHNFSMRKEACKVLSTSKRTPLQPTLIPHLTDGSALQVEQGRMPVEDLDVQDYFSKFEMQPSHGAEEIAAEAETGLTVGQIQSIAAAIKVL